MRTIRRNLPRSHDIRIRWDSLCQKTVRNRNFFENAGHVSFSFCQTGSAETHTKPCKTSPQGTSIKRPAIYWDHTVSWGGGSGLALVILVGLAKKTVELTLLVVKWSAVRNQCQSRLWSKRGTKVNGSHRGYNPLLRPTGIQIATKSYAALQAMAPTNIKTVHQTSLLQIESNLDRLGMLSPTHEQRSQQKNGKITLQPV